jgi:hypothetical protein
LGRSRTLSASNRRAVLPSGGACFGKSRKRRPKTPGGRSGGSKRTPRTGQKACLRSRPSRAHPIVKTATKTARSRSALPRRQRAAQGLGPQPREGRCPPGTSANCPQHFMSATFVRGDILRLAEGVAVKSHECTALCAGIGWTCLTSSQATIGRPSGARGVRNSRVLRRLAME